MPQAGSDPMYGGVRPSLTSISTSLFPTMSKCPGVCYSLVDFLHFERILAWSYSQWLDIFSEVVSWQDPPPTSYQPVQPIDRLRIYDVVVVNSRGALQQS